MTRKDYVAITTVINDRMLNAQDGLTDDGLAAHYALGQVTELRVIADRLADLFERDNPPNDHGGGFNKTRFLVACGIQEGVNKQEG